MALPLAVSDTSVLINIHHLDLLPSLSLLYRQVLVPAAVRTEFLRRDEQKTRETALTLLATRGFFTPCDEYDSIEVDLLKSYKMEGAEAEALSQLKIRKADVLLIDEKVGRKIAQREMRTVKGSVAVLGEFHKLRIIDLRTAISRLRNEVNFWVSEKVVSQVLKQVEE